jgi:hypothetical protein
MTAGERRLVSLAAALIGDSAVAWHEIASARKWSVLVVEQKQTPAGLIELGELFRVHRGQVTGANDVWIDNDAACDLPKRCKPFAVTSARELFCRWCRAELDQRFASRHRLAGRPR